MRKSTNLTGMSNLLGESPGGFEIYGDIERELGTVSFAPLDPALADPELSQDVFRVRLARPRDVQPEASALVQRRYAWRGYEVKAPAPDPNLYTFAAYNAGLLAGTMAIRLDSASGLSADQIYRVEVAELRAAGHRLTEFTRLALDETAVSKEVLAALFHAAYLYAHFIRGCSHAVIEVNPRHVAFYRRVLYFRQLSEVRHSPRVDAPAVLLVLDFQRITEKLKSFFAQPDWQAQTGSFFVNAFTPRDAPGVLARLQRLDAERARLAAADA